MSARSFASGRGHQFRFHKQRPSLSWSFGPLAAAAVASSGLATRAGGLSALSMSAETAEVVKPPQEVFRKDYTPPVFWTREVNMLVEIDNAGVAVVTTDLAIEAVEESDEALVLEGEDLVLKSLKVDGVDVDPALYSYEDEHLSIQNEAFKGKSKFTLSTVVEPTKPEENTQLSGLYQSNGIYCTQCEAEGFRRITFFQDRPDVMAKYTMRLEAPKEHCPVLLGNGNFIEGGDLEGGRHFAIWEDPWPKPCYLFALVAGDLGSISGTYTTMSGRKVKLGLFSEHDNVDKLDHALRSLQMAMQWDEEKFNLECDLDTYNVVAVSDFNMGAMENKGLNIFNTKLTLAKPDTAEDIDYERIAGVIAHEYFHNWTGNRVTCRDWFQLTLKEGLTVYRDQTFSADVGSSEAVKRIRDVRMLRGRQFTEDAGPLAHPIRPDSYIAMDNFYTSTVYEKGAEVIRMYEALLGKDGFRKGMDLYFERHDGSAVTCDDFRAAMADANDKDLTQFERWYLQAGTPVLIAAGALDSAGVYKLTLSQTTPATPNQPEKLPLHIPVRVGLLDADTGKEVVPTTMLELTEAEQVFELSVPEGVKSVIPSLLRGFSAPVRLKIEQSDEELAFLAAKDTDEFNKWEAGQRLGTRVVLRQLESAEEVSCVKGLDALSKAHGEILSLALKDKIDLSLAALAIRLPSVAAVSDELAAAGQLIDPVKVADAHWNVSVALAKAHAGTLLQLYQKLAPAPGEVYSLDSDAISRRALRNECLDLLSKALECEEVVKLAHEQFMSATCMTEKIAAFETLERGSGSEEAAAARNQFYMDANKDALVVDKWFAVQAASVSENALKRVRDLMAHPDFSIKSPNRLRALINSFVSNTKNFHKADGSGYALLGELVAALNTLNPQVASRLCGPLSQWRRYDEGRQELMKAELNKLKELPNVSKDLYEVVTKSLGS